VGGKSTVGTNLPLNNKPVNKPLLRHGELSQVTNKLNSGLKSKDFENQITLPMRQKYNFDKVNIHIPSTT
jgi:hypothetical protein